MNERISDYSQEKEETPGSHPFEQQPLVGDPPPPPYNELGPSSQINPCNPAQREQLPNVGHEQPTIVYVQNTNRLENPPKDYLIETIFATICCCWCIGVLAIMNSVLCREAISAGDRPYAELASKRARKYMRCTIWVGVVIIALSICSQIVKRVFLVLNWK